MLGSISLVVSIRGFFGVIAGSPPSWYEPSVVFVGLVGIAFTVFAFVTVARPRLPWALLGAATCFLTTAMVFTATAF